MKVNRKGKRLVLFLFVIIAISIIAYLFRPAPDCVCNKASKETLLASQLIEQYETDEKQANNNYLGKIITVKGKIASVKTDYLKRTVVEFESQSIGTVSCTLCKKESKAGIVTVGKTVSIKGECTGFTVDAILVKCCLED